MPTPAICSVDGEAVCLAVAHDQRSRRVDPRHFAGLGRHDAARGEVEQPSAELRPRPNSIGRPMRRQLDGVARAAATQPS
jgi:hypothetical protein